VQILFEGRVVAQYPRATDERVLIDRSCYEGAATADAIAPPPLGRMGQRLEELAAEGVARRSIDIYAALMEVAR
jgi:hypothetical protein